MPILIPSKNIYQVENPKVRDNVIERIEVKAVEVVPDNEYDTVVYNKTMYAGFEKGVPVKNENKKTDYVATHVIYSYYKITPTYITFSLSIPKIQENHFIEKIFHGYKIDGSEITPDIKISVYGAKYLGTINSIVKNPKRDTSTASFTVDIEYETPVYESIPTFSVLEINPQLEYEYVRQYGGLSTTSSVKGVFVNNDSVATPIYSEDDNNYYLEFTVFAGYEEIKAGGYVEYITSSLTPQWTEQNSECTKILPQKVEVSIYGNTIGIDLKDSVVHINNGDSTSKKVFAVDGNELMQTSNYVQLDTPTLRELDTSEYSLTWLYPQDQSAGQVEIGYRILIKNTALLGKNIMVCIADNAGSGGCYTYTQNNGYIKQMVFDEYDGHYITDIAVYEETDKLPAIKTRFSDTQAHYAIGKETATIRCAIADYYEFNKPTLARYCKISDNGLVDISNNIRATISFGSVTKLNVYFVDETPYDTFVSWLVKLKNTDGTITEKSGIIYAGSISATGMRISSSVESIVSVSAYFRKNMVFSTHDKVVPMVYGANGQDKPLSVYKDGTPKVFNVLGVEFLYDGAVWQILNLQEE